MTIPGAGNRRSREQADGDYRWRRLAMAAASIVRYTCTLRWCKYLVSAHYSRFLGASCVSQYPSVALPAVIATPPTYGHRLPAFAAYFPPPSPTTWTTACLLLPTTPALSTCNGAMATRRLPCATATPATTLRFPYPRYHFCLLELFHAANLRSQTDRTAALWLLMEASDADDCMYNATCHLRRQHGGRRHAAPS